MTLGLCVGFAPGRASDEPPATMTVTTTRTTTRTETSMYRHHSAGYWAWKFRRRTRQLQASKRRAERQRAEIRKLRDELHHRLSYAAPAPSVSYGVWDHLADCESGGDWADTAGSFEGGLQFLNSTWLAYDGGTYAAHAYSASRDQQITVAERVLAAQGWSAWPACSAKLGLR